ncbi:MAG: type I-E CRISPR-associated protein Cse2/CasB [Thermomicrobiales bacterium]|nr:type I-E CRISPR-associated protein Cse2/CasB [Thermomicrobiales bacterium]
MTATAKEYAELDVPLLIRHLAALAPREESEQSNFMRSVSRARLAALRRGLGKKPGEAIEVLPVLVPMLGSERLSKRDEAVAHLVATLFGSYPHPFTPGDLPKGHQSFGESLRRLERGSERTASEDASDQDDDEVAPDAAPQRQGRSGVERRLMALLDSSFEDLPPQLRGVVQMLEGNSIPVDWKQLAEDLRQWDHPDRHVQLRWARDFWREETGSGGAAPATEEGEDEEMADE